MDVSTLTPRVRRARELAIQAHGDQKYGDQPYVVHLDEVVSILIEFGYADDDTLIAGYLHDVCEDTRMTSAMVETEFGIGVRDVVLFCTDEKGTNRKERKAKTYARMRQALATQTDLILRGIRVKLADRLGNLRASTRSNKSLLSMYQKETESFRDALYTTGVADAMWLEYDRLLGVTL